MMENLTIALSHDVDRTHKSYQYITKSLGGFRSGHLKQGFYHLFSLFLKNPYWSFDRIIAIEKEYDVRSTFFFLEESKRFDFFKPPEWGLALGKYRFDKPKIAEMIRWLDQNGWEIGLHGSYNSYHSSELLSREKQKLESVVGHEILGIRQHFLNVDEETWRLQYQAGFGYDASLGYTRDIGFKNDRYHPFFPLDGNDRFLVIPMAVMDECLMKKKNIQNAYLDLLDVAEKNNAVCVVNWHQRIFNEREYPGYSRAYEEIIKEGKKRKARFTLLGKIYRAYVQDRPGGGAS
jgi:peptidoglycan/xylan/chitin deacetylase (PgdA/CDA1 family)